MLKTWQMCLTPERIQGKETLKKTEKLQSHWASEMKKRIKTLTKQKAR